jgi:hypothetical protein
MNRLLSLSSHAARFAIGIFSLCGATWGEDAAPTTSTGRQVTVVTTKDDQIKGPLLTIKDGTLEIGPDRSVSLMDVQKLTFGTTAGLHAICLGQDQHDLVQVGSAQGGNGVQDVHLRLIGLEPKKEIKQLRIVCRRPPRAWLLDPTDSPNWRLMVDRRAGDSSADIYFEPPPADLKGKQLQLTVTYGDDTSEKLSCAIETQTSDKLRMAMATAGAESKGDAPKDASHAELAVTAELATGDSLQGTLADLSEELLTLRTAWQPSLEISLSKLRGLVVSSAGAAAKKLYRDRKAQPGADDLALVMAKDGTLAEVAGHLKKWDGQQVHFVYEGEEKTIPTDRLQGIVFAAQPRATASTDPFQVIHLTSGDTISGIWTDVTESEVSLKTPWGATWQVPIDSIAELGTRNGSLVELSDLTPMTVEQTPYFGRLMPYQPDKSLEGGSLTVKGKTYSKGLAVHSRCVLTYPLDGKFANFKTLLGFDDTASAQGQVACRVLVDGKELYANPNFRADSGPQELDLPVTDAKQLTLEVGFGDNEDVGDRVIWADARLFRK